MILTHQLDALESADLIRRAQAQSEVEYLFRHALVQEATYDTLVKQDRRRLNLLVGEMLERLYPDQRDELAPRLAHHFDEAAAPARALAYYTRAGDLAARKYANAEAIMQYSRALELATSEALPDADLLHLYTARGRALEMSGQYDEALANYHEMEALARRRADRALELAALIARTTVHSAPTAHFDAEQAQALADRSLALAHALGDRAAEAKILWNVALIYKFRNRWQEVVEYGEQSAAIARELNLREQLAYTLNDISVAYVSIGQTQRARDLLVEAQQIWRELGNAPMLADNLANTAEMEFTSGNLERALVAADEAYRIGRSIGNLWNQSYALGTRGQAFVERGDIAEGIAAMEQALELGRQAGFGLAQVYGHGILGLIYGYLGAAERGIAEARRAVQAAEELFPGWRAMPMAMLVMVLVWNDALDEAATLIEQTHAAINPDDAQAAVLLAMAEGDYALARGEYAHARALAENLLTTLRAMDMRAYVGVVLQTQGEALLGLGRWAEAQRALDAARLAEESSGARRILWRILLRLSELAARAGDEAAAQRWRQQAREVIAYIAAHIDSPDAVAAFGSAQDRGFGQDLRATFLNLPDVRAVLNDV